MPRTLTRSVATMVADAKTRISEMTSTEAAELLGRDDVVIIDIRDPRERTREGVIPGSHSCPRGMLEFWVDPDSPYYKKLFDDEDKTYVFHCAGGLRSALAIDTLTQMGFKNATHISDGFAGWKQNDLPIEQL